MSVQPQGPGWWQASDGNWYPPQAWQPPPGQGGPPQQRWPQAGPPPKKSSNRGCWIAAIIVTVLILGVIGIGVFYLVRVATTITEGGVPGVGGSVACPVASEISSIVGSPVNEPQSTSFVGSTGCVYLAANPQAGVEVNLVVGPELIADEQLKDFADEARAAKVQSEPIAVGSRGQAWTYPTKSAAMAVGGGHVVLVEIMSASGSPIGDKKAAAVAVLSKVIG